MSDGKTRRGEPDRSRTNLNEEYEVRYWTEKLSVTEEQLDSPAVRGRLTLIARELEVRPGGRGGDCRPRHAAGLGARLWHQPRLAGARCRRAARLTGRCERGADEPRR